MRIEDDKCFECGTSSCIQHHHVVPRSRGGTRTIPLCEECHSKAHHRKKNMNTSRLTKEALANLKAQGVVLGNPRIAEARQIAIASRQKSAKEFRAKMRPVISEIQSAGITSHSGIARELNRRGYRTSRNKDFYPGAIKHVLRVD